jgi:hypothetical protein
MALESDAIESRLEGLRQDDRRSAFDSKIRAFRFDSEPPRTAGDRVHKPNPKVVAEEAIDRMVSLLEDLSRRIDGLERKDRALADEIRRRARHDRRRRAVWMVGGLALTGFVVLGWTMKWF